MKYDIEIAKGLVQILNKQEISLDKMRKFLNPAKKGVDADYAINCFALREFFGKDGITIAKEIHAHFSPEIIQLYPFLARVNLAGPYLNFKLDKQFLARKVITLINTDLHQFELSSKIDPSKTQRLVIEYPAPNTNKPLHLGHVRNMLLGQSLARINRKVGNNVFEVNLLNDRGIHIMKSVWAYQEYGKNTTPESESIKPDLFVGKYYVKYAQEEARLKEKIHHIIKKLEDEQQKEPKNQDPLIIKDLQKQIELSEYGKLQTILTDMLIRWEKNDPEIRSVWRKMNQWAEKGFKETFETFEITHVKTYYESNIYDKGKEIVVNGLKAGIFEKLHDGAVVINFQQKGFPKQKVLLRSDGTSLYITQDLYLAFQKMNDFQYDKSIYVVGNEQNMQLRTLFEILKRLGMKAENVHYSYGMINLTTGKMKSREGTVVDADDIVKKLQELGFLEVKTRYKGLSHEEMQNRAYRIAMAALRFFILKYDYRRDFLFDPKESIAFEGETGPYLLYAYARICSIYKKGIENGIVVPWNIDQDKKFDNFPLNDINFSLMNHPNEITLVEKLFDYPDALLEAAEQLKPHVLARYLFDLAQEFTSFYHECHIIGENQPVLLLRIALIESVRKVLFEGLKLLGIHVLTEM